MSKWQPIVRDTYDPLKAGSVDGTDTEPHDRAVWRAMTSHYTPPDIDSNPSHTLFVARLPHTVGEEHLHQKFSVFGVVEKIRLIRDIVTGFSKGYCFVEYRRRRDAEEALREATGLQIGGCPVLVDWEAGHQVKGWIPRRLGGGWGGRKEAGQLRFGCRDRPWKKPIVFNRPKPSVNELVKDAGRQRHQGNQGPERRKRDEYKHQDSQGPERYKRDEYMHHSNQEAEEKYKRNNYRYHSSHEEAHRRNDPRYEGSKEKQRREGDRYQDRHRQNDSRYQDSHRIEERHRREGNRSQNSHKREDYKHKEDTRRREEKYERHRDRSDDRKRRRTPSPC